MANYDGTAGADTYTGGDASDTINGNGGNDRLNGAGGSDVVAGDDGADTVDGGEGDDWLYSAHVSPPFTQPYYTNAFTPPLLDAGTEVDTIHGGNGDDRIFAGYGDNVDGGANGALGDYLFISFKGATSGVTADFHQSSLVIGGGTITGIENISWVQGSEFDDDINVGTNTNYGYSDFTAVFGGGGNDHLVAGSYTGVLFGEAGNDVLDGRGSGYLSRVDGGDGDDTLYTNANTFAVAEGGAGNDTIYSHGTTYGGEGNDKIYLQNSYYGGQVYGEAGNDEIHAADTGSYISGGTGVDMLIGGEAGDYLMSGDFVIDGSAPSDSGVEHDVLTGGGGNDTLEIGYGDDADGGTGTNRLIVSLQGATSGVTFNFGSILAGTTTIGGGTIKNIQAVDTVWGSAFADIIIMPSQAFTATVHGGAGNDTIGGGTTALAIYGDDGDDTLTGTAGNDTIEGGAGNDTITGGAGLDIIRGGAGYDFIRIGDGDFVAGEVYDAGADGGRLVVTASTVVDLSTATVTSFSDLYGGSVKLSGAQFVQFGSITGSIVTLTDGGTITGNVFVTPLYNTVINLAPVDTVFNAVRSLGTQGDGALTINGNIGNDTIYGTDLNDSLNGGGGNDTIYGGGGYDYLTGGNGNDVLDGGGSFDDMTGGLGDDTYYVDNNGDIVHENANEGYDTEIGSVGFVLADNVEHGILSGTTGVNLFGNSGDNWLTGNDGANTLYGLGGNDRLEGGAGADTLIGGIGDDTYVWDGVDTIVENAGEGNDTVESATATSLTAFTNIENLTLTGNAAINGAGDANSNVIRGNSAANTLDGAGGADKLYGGGGDDTYLVNNAGVQIVENANEGTDTVRSSVTFTLGANVENLVLTGTGNINGYGNSGQNVITGNAGSNALDGGGGGDTLQGGAGNDVYYVRNAADVIVENAGEGTADTVLATVSYALGANAQVERLAASDSNLTTAINLTGNAYSHLIQGNNGVNVLTGGTGNDNLFGYAGDDRLVGGQGVDQMTGGIGNDTYVVDNAGDQVIENANEGTDTVEASVSYTLGANVENLTLTGASAIDGTGNAGANVIRGNSAANTLNGAGGADTLYGGGGDDTFIVDTAGVQVIENANEGIDTVRSSLSYTLGANLENLVLTGTANINGYGNAGHNTITGNAGNNVLDGAGGGDTLQGGAGNDVYYVRNAADVIVENSGEGTVDTVLAAVSYTLGANAQVERLAGADANLTTAINLTGNAWSHLIQGNAGVNTLTGGTGNDSLYGYAGDDRLDGGQGTDTLYGGIGNDTYVVDSLSDVIVENANEGSDTVEASLSYSLAALANVENLTLTGVSAIDGTGNTLDNVIHGNSAANTLNGGTGSDLLYGGAGDDIYVIGDAHAKVIELAGEGNDTVQASVDYSLAGTSNIETLMLTGSAMRATGNAEHNILIGNAVSNVLDGAGGGDTLQGGAGNDVYYVRNAGDVIVENTGEGTADTVLATVSYTLTASAQVERLAAADANTTAAINLTGNAWSHTIQGNNGANVLTGGSGADTLFGYGGNDTLNGGSGADKFVFAHGTGQDTIGDFIAGTDKIDLTAIGFASYQDVITATHDVGGNAVIDLGNGDQVTLTGVTTAQLHSGDFIGVGNSAAAAQMQLFAAADTWHGGADMISVLHG